jgi:hypothetical protein
MQPSTTEKRKKYNVKLLSYNGIAFFLMQVQNCGHPKVVSLQLSAIRDLIQQTDGGWDPEFNKN